VPGWEWGMWPGFLESCGIPGPRGGTWGTRSGGGLEEGQGLELRDFEAFAAADIAAGYHVVATDHVGLGFGEAGPVSVVGVPRELGAFSADDPLDLVVGGLAAVRADERVGARFVGFCEKIAFFHK
jgi:hypothetical protein